MGYPIDAASLTRQDDGTERDADWDGDGASNVSEITDETDPRYSNGLQSSNNQGSGTPDETSDDQNNGQQAQQSDTGVAIDVEVEFTMEETVIEMRRKDEQAYQAAMMVLWSRSGAITQIPSQELDHLDELYPLCEHAQTYSRNQRETFKLCGNIARTEAAVYAAVVAGVVDLLNAVNWTIRAWQAWGN